MKNKQVLQSFFNCEHFCNMSVKEAGFYFRRTFTLCKDCLNQPTCPRTTDPEGFCDKGEPDLFGNN